MTHDELLAKIDEECATTYEDATGNVPMSPNALRAVVELHEPIHNPNFEDSEPWCWQCAEGRGYAKYPCPTIQAIEKELS